MAKNENTSNKKRNILIIVFICLIVLATICVLVLSPFGKSLLGIGKNGEPIGTPQTDFISENVKTTLDTSKVTLISPDEMPSVSVPKPTSPTVDTNKNYTFFVDKNVFDCIDSEGVTTLKAKDNNSVIITVTPYNSVSYSSLCSNTAKIHERDGEQPKLNIENLYAVYHSDKNGTTTTVYCIDDNNGGSIKLKYERPSDADEYDKNFEILASMFKVK